VSHFDTVFARGRPVPDPRLVVENRDDDPLRIDDKVTRIASAISGQRTSYALAIAPVGWPSIGNGAASLQEIFPSSARRTAASTCRSSTSDRSG
jgi:hypothetical protein